jgi:hypothetical protein
MQDSTCAIFTVHNTPTYYYYYVTLINIMKNVGEVMRWGKLWGTRISTKIIAVALFRRGLYSDRWIEE